MIIKHLKKRPDYLDILNAYNLDFDLDSMTILKATKKLARLVDFFDCEKSFK